MQAFGGRLSRQAMVARLRPRLGAVVVAAGFAGYAFLTGGVSAATALTGLLAVVALLVLWPDGAVPATTESPPAPTSSPADAPAATFGAAVARSAVSWPALLEGIPDAAVMLQADTTILLANRLARDGLRVRPGLHLAHSIREPGLLAAVDRALREGQPQAVEVNMPMPNERMLSAFISPLAVPVSPSATPSDDPALLIVLRDRTEEQQLAQMRADFVANASHELRTPLASLKGFVETLQGAAKDDPVARQRFLAIMQEQAGRMTRLIEDLLSLSRVEMHEHLPPQGIVEMADLVENVARALEPMAEQADRSLTVVIGARPVFVHGDRDELAQVAHNLVQNAIKYGKPGGRIAITLEPENERVALAVTDDGIGIAPEHLPRLTERFYRVSAKASRDRGGTGLGLAIVKHIVNRHRGELKITSEVGKGSRFAILLPTASDIGGALIERK